MSPAAVQYIGKDKENIQPGLADGPPVSKRHQKDLSIIHTQTYLSSPLTTLLASSQSQSPITPHDLLEAYHTLSYRLKALLPLVLIPGSGDVRIEALDPLRSDAPQLVQVLKRDIERALVNPLLLPSSSTTSSYPYPSVSNQTASLSSAARYRSTTHIQQLNLTPADLKRASDEVGICHAALGLAGVLFRFECLFWLFEAQDLRTLLHSTLSLIPTPQFTNTKNKLLPTPSSTKTRSLVVWLLRTQRLPKEVLDDAEEVGVINVVGGILTSSLCEGGGEAGEGEKMVGDAFKVFQNLLTSLPSPSPSNTILLRTFTNLLPNVLGHLVSPSAELKWDAAGVLGKVCVSFVWGCGDSGGGEKEEIEGMWDICAGHVRAFIDAYSSRRNNAIRLSDVLSTALHASSHPDTTLNSNLNSKHVSKSKSKHGRSASWAIHTLLTLLILSSPPSTATATKSKSAYTHPRSLKLFVTLFGEALNSTRKEVRKGGVGGWAGLVWVFGRLCGLDGGTGEEEGERLDADVEERAFRVVKQELGAGIGVLLVNVLLSGCGIGMAMESALGSAVGGPESTKRSVSVGRVLVVVGDMIRSERKSTAKEGVEVLGRLVSGIGSSISTSPSIATASRPQPWMPPRALYDGTLLTRGLGALLQGEQHHNSTSGSSFGLGFGSGSEDVRQLTEAEVGTWWEVLIRVWGEGVDRFLLWVEDEGEQEGRKVVCDHLVQIWQSLLLVQAQLTQGLGHLTAHTEFAHRTASLLCGFLAPSLHPPTTKPSPPSFTTADSQHSRLKLVSKLWRVVKNVFASSWLPKPAERILRGMLGIKWYLHDDRVKGAWDVLSAELAAAASVGAGVLFLLNNVNGSGDGDNTPTEQRKGTEGGCEGVDVEMKRELWGVLAKMWKGREVDVDWEDAVRFLGIPFGVWAMTHIEIGLWESMLRCAITAAGTVSVTPVVVVEMILHRLGERKVDRSSRFIEVTGILLSHLDILSTTTLPTEFFTMFNEILEHLYPPLHPQDLPPSLRLLCALKAVIIATPLSLVVPLLTVIQSGLCVWTEDKKEVIPEIVYNDVIMSLYTDSLTKLRNHPLSVNLLQALTPFFASAFSRIPPPALGPLAFQAFWKATYYGKDKFFREIPPKLRACLKAFDDAYGDDLAMGLSHDVESQSAIGSSVPDSEPSRAQKGLIHMPLPHGSPQTTPKAITDVQSAGFEQNALSSSPVSFEHEAAADSTSILQGLALTPSANRPILSIIPPVSALSQLKDYSSRVEDNVDEPSVSITPYLQSLRPGPPSSPIRSQTLPSRQSPKRPHDVIEETSPKRARTEPKEPTLTKSAEDLATILVEPLSISQLQRTRSRKQNSNLNQGKQIRPLSSSEPTSRVMSPVAHTRNSSVPTPSRRRMRFDGVEVPTYSQILEQERGLRTPSPGFVRSPQSQELSDDFDSWEAGLDISELQSLQNGDISVPDTEMYDSSDVQLRHSSPIGRSTGPSIEGPSLISPFPVRRGQSQILAQVSPPQHALLRRARTTSARLDVLHEAYNVVSNDASQMQVQDLVQATRLVHQIGSVLNEYMDRRLNDRSAGH